MEAESEPDGSSYEEGTARLADLNADFARAVGRLTILVNEAERMLEWVISTRLGVTDDMQAQFAELFLGSLSITRKREIAHALVPEAVYLSAADRPLSGGSVLSKAIGMRNQLAHGDIALALPWLDQIFVQTSRQRTKEAKGFRVAEIDGMSDALEGEVLRLRDLFLALIAFAIDKSSTIIPET